MPTKSWSDPLCIGDVVISDASVHYTIVEIGASGKTAMLAHMEGGESYWETVENLKKAGWTIEGKAEKWEPKVKEIVWYIGSRGVEWMNWDPTFHNVSNFPLGIYPTKEKAEEALKIAQDAIREKMICDK